ncbi:MAG: MBL fold metallo-hydrolase [Candidatus Euphemobacter frigidus]|nr:MBL fold metallo-hydrolase [Candidatus Euphemobacter frigidus]MDP8275943.1 MBL fold metallo-hydrolase [Candidatus Euphemobacter frigidus]
MKIKRLVVGPLQANCYLLADEPGGSVGIIDPGGDPEEIRSIIERENWTPVVLINTHGHIDHIAANRILKERYDIPLLIHAGDADCLTDPALNLSMPGFGPVDSPPCDRELRDDDEITVGRLTLKVIHSPGHSPGSICLNLHRPGEPNIIFTGDTLFAGGVGRTDFPGGSMNQLMASIKDRLFTFPDETIILPGHGPRSTIGEERRSNPL